MFASPPFQPLALLYYVCFLCLAGLMLFVVWRGQHRPPTRARLRHLFGLLSLSLLLWLLTLFWEVRTTLPAAQLGLGRVNFAAVLFAAYFAVRFVEEIPRAAADREASRSAWLLGATGLLGALTLFTPLITAAERVEAGRAITHYGPLFPVYLLHVLGCLMAALVLAFQEWQQTNDRKVRGQLALIGFGMLTTGSVALICNALLPYVWGDFRFCDGGPLSTLLFVLATAYATFLHGLFDLRVLLRRTLVYGLLLAFVLGAYSSTVFLLSEHLTESTGKLTQFAVLLIAFSVDPLRRFLEEKAEHLLFGKQDDGSVRRKAPKDGTEGRAGRSFT